MTLFTCHDDVIEWKHFSRYWPFVRGTDRSPVNSPHKGQWRGALVFSMICSWINSWVKKSRGCWLWRHCNGGIANCLLADAAHHYPAHPWKCVTYQCIAKCACDMFEMYTLKITWVKCTGQKPWITTAKRWPCCLFKGLKHHISIRNHSSAFWVVQPSPLIHGKIYI